MRHVFIPPRTPRCGSRRHLDEPRLPAVRPGYLLCEVCLDGVEDALVDLSEWYALGQRGARERGTPPPADVVEVASAVVESFSSWCAVVVSQRGVPAPEPPTVMLLAGYLAVHLQWLTTRPAAAEFADDLMVLDQAVRRVERDNKEVA